MYRPRRVRPRLYDYTIGKTALKRVLSKWASDAREQKASRAGGWAVGCVVELNKTAKSGEPDPA